MTFRTTILALFLIPYFLSIGQEEKKRNNEIELDIGLLNTFFDGTPLMSTNYASGKVALHALFSSSIGIIYNRHILENHFISVGFNYYRAEYPYTRNLTNDTQVPACSYRDWFLINLGYLYNFEIGKRIKLRPEVGFLYRHGLESIAVGIDYIGWHGVYTERVDNRDLGLYLNLNMQVKINKLLYFHTSFDFSSIVYFGHEYSKDRMRNGYGISEYPTRFNLSWHFGLGFAF